MENKLVVQISQKDLLCVTGCGFYGNPQWQGFCSICWRNYQRQLHSQAEAAGIDETAKQSTPSSSPSNTSTGSFTSRTWSGLAFEKFLEKKNHQSHRKTSTLRSFLRKSPSSDVAAAATAPSLLPFSDAASSTLISLGRSSQSTPKQQQRSTLKRQLSNESQSAKVNFLSFLHKVPKSVAHDVIKQTSTVVEKILTNRERDHVPIDELAEMVQDAYQTISDRLRRSAAMKDCEVGLSQILDEVEAYICTRCYHVLFCPITDEEVEDLSLQDRIRSLHWVTYGFLQTGFDFSNPVVKDRIDAAVTEINDINSSETTFNSASRRHPQRKLDAVLQCSKSIFEALRESRGAPASADEFLPALIYVILRSNPPQLKSNTTFVTRFALPTKLMSGEAGYYFTNLCCALQFVQNLNADSLTMPREEFEAYTSGQMMPPVPDAAHRCTQAVKSLENSLDELKQLNIRKDRLLQRIDDFEREDDDAWERIFDSVQKFKEEHPPGKTLDVAWLESSPDKEELLPPPLQPIVASSSTGFGASASSDRIDQ